jgi:hypothetical protein
MNLLSAIENNYWLVKRMLNSSWQPLWRLTKPQVSMNFKKWYTICILHFNLLEVDKHREFIHEYIASLCF